MPTADKSRITHYDTLGLKENCTERDVKDAFLSLSKAHHPDLNPNDPSQQEKFVEIYEAYSILSRPERRLIYDSDLRIRQRLVRNGWTGSNNGVETDAPRYTTWKDESLWHMRDKTAESFDKNKPYYGMKGVNRVSNGWIAGGAIFVMLFGALVHYTAFKHAIGTFTVTQLDTKDERIARELFKARQTAISNGNAVQLALFKEKFGWEEQKSESDSSKD